MPLAGRLSKEAVRGAKTCSTDRPRCCLRTLSALRGPRFEWRPDMVVVVSLRRDNLARLPRLRNMCTQEHVPIETLVAKLAVEALDEHTLHRLAGLDVVLGDPIDGPVQRH